MSAIDITYDIRDGHLVECLDERRCETAPVSNILACLHLLGFSQIATGGGCTAMSIERGEKYLLVTVADDASMPVNGEDIAIGCYSTASGAFENSEGFGDDEMPVTFTPDEYEEAVEQIVEWLGVSGPVPRPLVMVDASDVAAVPTLSAAQWPKVPTPTERMIEALQHTLEVLNDGDAEVLMANALELQIRIALRAAGIEPRA